MENVKKIWFAEQGIADISLTKERVMAEIARIKKLNTPLTDKIIEIRYLIEQFFKSESNEELLNANLPW